MKVIGESKHSLGDIIKIKNTGKMGVISGIEVFVSFESNYIQYEIGEIDFYKESEIEAISVRPETLTVTDKE